MNEELNLLAQRVKSNVKITDIWSVSYTKGEYHSPHNHGSLGWAGILYLDLPKDSPVTSYLQPWNDIQNDTSIYHPVKVVEGQIVIVPGNYSIQNSYLFHVIRLRA